MIACGPTCYAPVAKLTASGGKPEGIAAVHTTRA